MPQVIQDHVTTALRELADEAEQRRLWLASDTEVSSFTEAVAGLFDDSGLGDALDGSEEVYNWAIDGRLRLLSDALGRVPRHIPVQSLIAHPTMDTVRTLATALLHDLDNQRFADDA